MATSSERGFFGHPRPLGPLFFTEMWERFSFYGIRPLLVLYMAATLAEGGLGIPRDTAAAIVGIFGGMIYLSALPGGWLADNWLGQRRAVWYGSILIALGHLSIALSALWGAPMFYIGLILLVLGSGIFKTCMSVMVGTLYPEGDARRDGGFSIFYMGINLGAVIAPLITGLAMDTGGWHWGFGAGGIGMLVALAIFRMVATPSMKRFDREHGRESSWDAPVNRRRHVGTGVTVCLVLIALIMALGLTGIITFNPIMIATTMSYVVGLCVLGWFMYLLFFSGLDRAGRARVIVCLVLFAAAALFWASFEQQPTSYNLFAADYTDRNVLGMDIPVLWFQSLNPLFIIVLAPLFGWLWPAMARGGFEPSSATKFSAGLLFAAAGFGLMMVAAWQIVEGAGQVSPLWITASLLLLTLGELCLSPVGLSTMTELAPTPIRGQIMGIWFAATALGNLVAGLIGGHVSAEHVAQLPELFGRCALALLIGAVILMILIRPIRHLLGKGAHEDAGHGTQETS
ncbi:MFS transporter [Kushneria pakistanensis]|uniref:MFS transporter n=1 Tax=Kushneria pakistanensis TaxID=1508770 RepID=A0ABQ3FJR5_9GAMM|nr:peptide MFS transporter [Kushneria pakistanensis]GHC25991.1 MFS transporter [Kushneria pakistanensis]